MKRLARFGRQYPEVPDRRSSLPWSDSLLQDLRMAMRSLRRNRVSVNFFSFLGVPVASGRGFDVPPIAAAPVQWRRHVLAPPPPPPPPPCAKWNSRTGCSR
jgi:hypothetical protein